jgi:hypothetical protein
LSDLPLRVVPSRPGPNAVRDENGVVNFELLADHRQNFDLIRLVRPGGRRFVSRNDVTEGQQGQ